MADPVTQHDDAMLAGSTKSGTATGGVGSNIGGSTLATGVSAGSTMGGGTSSTADSSTTGGSTTAGSTTGSSAIAEGGVAVGADRACASGATAIEGSGASSPAGGAGRKRGAQIVGDQTSDHDGPGPHLMTADTLIGNQVVNHQGEVLGEIEDIMLDVPHGRIAYAVMVAGGFLGMGEKMFALPWSALTLDTTRKCFILDADMERISNAPGFDKDHWPSQADREWQHQVHSYYKARAYYEE